jgi:hypothetical protein
MKDELLYSILLGNIIAIFIIYWIIRKAVAHGISDYHKNNKPIDNKYEID